MIKQINDKIIYFLFFFIATVFCLITVLAPLGTWIPIILLVPFILIASKPLRFKLNNNKPLKAGIIFLALIFISTFFLNSHEIRFQKLLQFTLLSLSGFLLIARAKSFQNISAIVFLFSISLIISGLIIILDFQFKIGFKLWLSSNLDFNNFENFYTLKNWIGIQDFRNSNAEIIGKYLNNTYDRGVTGLAVLALPLAALCYKYNHKCLCFSVLLVSFTATTFFYNLTIFISYIIVLVLALILFLTKKTFKNIILIVLGAYFLLAPFLVGFLDYKKFDFYINDNFRKIMFLNYKYMMLTSKCSDTVIIESARQYYSSNCNEDITLSLNYFSKAEKKFTYLIDVIIKEKLIFERKLIHRLIIWSYAKEKILEKPLLGHGAFSAKFVGEDHKIIDPNNNKEISVIPLHPHNNLVQLWLELGLLGVIAFYYFIYCIISRLESYDGKKFYLSVMPIISFIQVFYICQLSY